MSHPFENHDLRELARAAISQPLVKHLYTADPSAHVIDGRVYIYCSHDIDAGVPFNDNGDHFAMEDYHVFSLDDPAQAEARDHGLALHLREVPWAARQLWAPDALRRDGRTYFYFPAKAHDGLFRIGVAVGDDPAGPFAAEPEPIPGSYSIDPCVFEDDDGACYLYFGGIWGGQLQHYRDNVYDPAHGLPADEEPALGPRVARLADDLKHFAEAPREVVILDEHGEPLRAGDNRRRYFEGPWMHKYQGRYYLSYSTGDTHRIVYAVGDSPYGPFTWQGVVLTPVVGWTTHHSICRWRDRWYLFYHDSLLSGGVTHLRSIKMTPLHIDESGRIATVHPYGPRYALDD